jgi:DNA-binding LacI/PurR family transcriptional regulator
MSRMTLKDIARLSGYSEKTISRVINDESHVKPETRQKILETIRKYDYRPNIIARSLASRRSYTLGLIVHNITNPFYPKLIETVEQKLSRSDYSLLLCIPGEKKSRKKECIQSMVDKMVDGFLLTFVDETVHAELQMLKKQGIPFVIMLNTTSDFPCNYVGVDNVHGSRLMMEHLFASGFRRIAFINGPRELNVCADRLRGYKSFLMEHDLSTDEDLIAEGSFRYDGGFQAFTEIIKKHPDVEAVFCANDYMALGAIEAAKKMRLRVPEDIFIAGFDDIPISAHSNIQLTTVRIPLEQMAQTALDIIMDELGGKAVSANKRVILQPQLIIR